MVADTQGNPLELIPVESWFTAATEWAGEDLVLVRKVTELGFGDRHASAFERWSPADPSTPRVRTLVPGNASTLSVTPDGARAVLGLDNEIAVHDAGTGARETGFAIAGIPTRLATAGAGDALVIAAAIAQRVHVLDRHGAALDTFAIDGTTPTILRRYGRDPEHPTRHDNVLRDSKSWVEAIALSADGRFLAIGGSDSTVRLHDRRVRGSKPKHLAAAWVYRERRHRGGNPDLNPPLAMRFSGDGKRLVVTYRKGDVITWDVARGRQVAKLAGTCSREELVVFANRDEPPTALPRAPTPEDLDQCGAATSAAIAPDGSWYASHIDLVRVRGLPAGKPLAMIREVTLPGMLAISRGGQLAMVDIYGRTALWTASAGYRELLPTPASTNALVGKLSRSGRMLTFPLGDRLVAWDLAADRELAAPGRLAAISEDGTRTIAHMPTGLELRIGGIASQLALPDRELEFASTGSHVLAATPTGFVVRDLERATDVAIAAPPYSRHALRADGRRLATFHKQQPLEIWDTETGGLLAALEAGVEAVAFFADNRRLVTVANAKGQATAKIRELGGTKVTELSFTGWISSVDVAPDDSELLLVFQDRIVRHAIAHGTRVETAAAGQTFARYVGDGMIALEAYHQIELRRGDEPMTLVARLYPLGSGGYLVASAADAIHGSPDARDSIVSRVGGARPASLTGRETWDLWARPETFACAMAGEIAAPPGSP